MTSREQIQNEIKSAIAEAPVRLKDDAIRHWRHMIDDKVGFRSVVPGKNWITDTGELRDSLEVNARTGHMKIAFYAAHAPYVRHGYVTSRGRRIPSRDYIKEGLRQFQMNQRIKREVKQRVERLPGVTVS
jgi:hypothetical protein